MSRTLVERAGSVAPPDMAYWRSELLQAMVWLRQEGFGYHVDRPLLMRFLGPDAGIGVRHLDRLVDEGYLEGAGDRYWLSEAGARLGERELAVSFGEARG